MMYYFVRRSPDKVRGWQLIIYYLLISGNDYGKFCFTLQSTEVFLFSYITVCSHNFCMMSTISVGEISGNDVIVQMTSHLARQKLKCPNKGMRYQ